MPKVVKVPNFSVKKRTSLPVIVQVNRINEVLEGPLRFLKRRTSLFFYDDLIKPVDQEIY